MVCDGLSAVRDGVVGLRRRSILECRFSGLVVAEGALE